MSTPKFAVPPPFRPIDRPINQEPTIPGELVLDQSGKLLRRYFEIEKPFQFLQTIVDNWLINRLPVQISAPTIKLSIGTVRFERVFLVPPTYTVDGKTVQLHPQVARDSKLTYSMALLVDMVLEPNSAMGRLKEERIEKIMIGKVPVMLGSSMCYLHGKSKAELLKMGEEPSDPFGYYIVNGSEQLVLLQEKLRANKPLLFDADKKGEVIVRWTCPTIMSSKIVSVSKHKERQTVDLSLPFLGKEDSKPPKPNTIGAFQIFRLFGNHYPDLAEFKSPERILEAIKQLCLPSRWKRVRQFLQPSLLELGAISDDITNISDKRGSSKIDRALQEELIFIYLQDEFFPQESNPLNKLIMLGLMILRLAEYYTGYRRIDNRDDWSNKRLESAGRQVEQLFGGLWMKLINTLQTNADEKRYTTLNQLKNQINPSIITDDFVNSFNGINWGVSGLYSKQNITDIVNRMSGSAMISHLGRINTPASSQVKSYSLRMVQPSQLGFVCPAHTPEGAQCGLVKNIAITASLSIERSELPVIQKLQPRLSSMYTPSTSTLVLLNGKVIGWGSGVEIRDYCISERRQNRLYSDLSIVLNRDNQLQLYCDGSRPIRPLLIVDENEKLVMETKNLWDADIGTWLEEEAVEYLDASEQEEILLAQSIFQLKNKQQKIGEMVSTIADLERQVARLEKSWAWVDTATPEKIASFIGSQIERLSAVPDDDPNYAMATVTIEQLQKDFPAYRRSGIVNLQEQISIATSALVQQQTTNRFTHCEMDPTAILGFSTALLPVPEKEPSPRVTFGCSMTNQAMGVYHSNQSLRFDVGTKTLAFPTQPLFQTQMASILGLDKLPAGDNIIVAIALAGGFNQEDAFIFNQGSIDRGLFLMAKFGIYSSVENTKKNDIIEYFGRPPIRANEAPGKYAVIDEQGVPRIGAKVQVGDAIIGRLRKNVKTGDITNASVFSSDEGVIDRVIVSYNGDNNRIIKVKLRTVRTVQIGDKYASRYSQKGTVGLIVAEEDMPYTRDGIRPDIIINPHSIPSRMTIGKLMEIIASKVSALAGERQNATAFRPGTLRDLTSSLGQYGYNISGKEVMYSGKTGKQFEAEIYIGPCYYQALRHHVLDKIQARGLGPINAQTRQPVAGRQNNGGLRFGEMERDALIAHGASATLVERLCVASDPTKQVFCRRCGAIAISNCVSDMYICRQCGTNDLGFGVVNLTHSFKLLMQYLAGVNLNMTLDTKLKEALIANERP